MSDGSPDTALAMAVPAMPQTLANLSSGDRATMSRIGASWNEDINLHRRIVMDIYSPLAASTSKARIAVARNLGYGSHPRQVLDVFASEGASSRPVVAFVHGGAFVRGQKDMNEEIYSNVLWYFARHGMVGVNIEYRHAPEAAYPAGALDVGMAVAWIRDNIASYGGDPSRIALIGHSAGGTHVATYMFDPNMGSAPDPRVKGIALISARLRADMHAENPNAENVAAYFGTDEALFDERSPVTHANRYDVPTFTAIAEHENRFLDIYGAEFYWRMAQARGRAPRFLRLPGHNHTSIVAHINTGEDILGSSIRDFLVAECGFAIGIG